MQTAQRIGEAQQPNRAGKKEKTPAPIATMLKRSTTTLIGRPPDQEPPPAPRC